MANIEVYHGTGIRALPDLEARENLFGMFFCEDPASSGILTDSFDFARGFAAGAEIGGRGKAMVMTFEIPQHILIPTEPAGTTDVQYYYTEDWVDPRALPYRYLRATGITVEEAIARVAAGEMKFYQVPFQYFKKLSLIDI